MADMKRKELVAIAQQENPRRRNWVQIAGGGSRRKYVCYLCGELIDTESARYPMTKHASEAIDEHMNEHLKTLEQRNDT